MSAQQTGIGSLTMNWKSVIKRDLHDLLVLLFCMYG